MLLKVYQSQRQPSTIFFKKVNAEETIWLSWKASGCLNNLPSTNNLSFFIWFSRTSAVTYVCSAYKRQQISNNGRQDSFFPLSFSSFFFAYRRNTCDKLGDCCSRTGLTCALPKIKQHTTIMTAGISQGSNRIYDSLFKALIRFPTALIVKIIQSDKISKAYAFNQHPYRTITAVVVQWICNTSAW